MENFPSASRQEAPLSLSPFIDGDSSKGRAQPLGNRSSRFILSIFDDMRQSMDILQRSEFTVPSYYLRSLNGSESELKLKQSQIKHFSLDSLFYSFHCLPDDILQTMCGQELLSRGWKYHKDNFCWVRPAAPADRETLGAQLRQFVYFDASSWTQKVFQGQLDHTRLMVASEHAPSTRGQSFSALKTGPPGVRPQH